MTCVHGRDVSFGSECWECEQEKRRHRESVKLQEKALEDQREAIEQQRRHYEESRVAQERQEELLREAAYAQDQAAQAQRAQLALHQAQVEEARARQQAEEERQELRTGLPEFSEDYRNAWLSVSGDHEALEAKTATLNAELERAIARERSISGDVTKIWDQIHRDLAEELQAKLAQGTPALNDPPPELVDAKDRQELQELAELVSAMGGKLNAPAARLLPTDGPVLRLYREMAAVAERLDLLTKAPPKTPTGSMGCLLFLLACVVVGIAGALQQPGKYTVAILFYVLVAALPAIIVARRYSLINAISSTSLQAHDLMNRVVTLLAKIPDVDASPPPHLISSSQGSRQDRLKALAGAIAAGLHANVLTLLEMYKSANFKAHPKAPNLAELSAQWKVSTDRIADIRRQLERSPSEALTEESFESLRQEIRRVGRLILAGRRVAGGRIELLRCSACGAMLSSEMRGCPRCGQGT